MSPFPIAVLEREAVDRRECSTSPAAAEVRLRRPIAGHRTPTGARGPAPAKKSARTGLPPISIGVTIAGGQLALRRVATGFIAGPFAMTTAIGGIATAAASAHISRR